MFQLMDNHPAMLVQKATLRIWKQLHTAELVRQVDMQMTYVQLHAKVVQRVDTMTKMAKQFLFSLHLPPREGVGGEPVSSINLARRALF